MLEHRLELMQTPKHDISVGLKEKLPMYERQMINLISSSKKHSPQVHGQQQFQRSNVGNAHSIPEQHQSQSSQMPQGSGTSLKVSGASNVQHVSMPSSTEQENISDTLHPSSNTNAVQGSSFNLKRLGAIGSELMQQQQRHTLLQKEQPLQQNLHQQQNQQPQLHIPQVWQLHSINDLNELKAKQGSDIKSRLNEYSAGQCHAYYCNQLKPGASYPVPSPQILPALSPQISHHSSHQIDRNGQLLSIPKAKVPPLSANSPLSVTPSTPFSPSPTPVDSEKQQSANSSAAHQKTPAAPLRPHSVVISTAGISASPLLAECTSQDENQANEPATSITNVTEQPVYRLIKVVQSLTPEALSSAVNDIESFVSMIDRIAGSAPGNGSRAAAGEDLAATSKCHLQTRNFMSRYGGATRKKLKRHTVTMPLNDVFSPGSDDRFKQLHGFESSELESTAISRVKRCKHEANHRLVEEIWKINQKLIGTVVDMSENNEGEEGIAVKFSYTTIALNPGLKTQFACTGLSPVMNLRIEVPANYPECSPVLSDKLPDYPSKDFEDLSTKAKSKFTYSLRHLSQPISLGEMAKTWDICAREVILEYAQITGGGSFSSTYGSWENCIVKQC